MSSWRFLTVETSDPDAFLKSLEAALGPYANDYHEREPKVDAPTRVRVSIGTSLRPRDDREPSHDEAWSVTTFFHEMITRGAIAPVDWAVIVRGGDTADVGSADVYQGTERIDQFGGQEGRLGYDAAAYLERVHGVLVDPTPPTVGWGGEGKYNPEPELRGERPERTLTDARPEPPFEFGNDDAYVRVVGETETPETVREDIEALADRQGLAVEETAPRNPRPNRLRFDFESTYIGSRPARWRFIEDSPIAREFTWLVVVQGTPDRCHVNVEAPFEKDSYVVVYGIDSKLGDPAGLTRYLEAVHGVSVDATPPSVDEIPRAAEMPDGEPDHGTLSEQLEKHTER